MNLFRPQKPYRFLPPKYHPFYRPLLKFLTARQLRMKFHVTELEVKGGENLETLHREGHSLLITPNHADHSDPAVLIQAGGRHGLPFHFMAAREGFEKSPMNAFFLQRFGAFSVDREGNDLSAIKTAIKILQGCRYPLIIFPEGEIYHHHEKLDVLHNGVVTIRLRSLNKIPEGKNAYLVPAAIRIAFDDSVEASFSDRLSRLEERITFKPRPELPVIERLDRLGSGLIALKEAEFLNEVQNGTLAERIQHLQEKLVAGIEESYGITPPVPKADEASPTDNNNNLTERVKILRQKIRRLLTDPDEIPTGEEENRLYDQLDTLFTAVQLYSYPESYVIEKPSVTRIAETVFKLEEDLFGEGDYSGEKKITVIFDDPINIGEYLEKNGLTPKNAVTPLSAEIFNRIRALLED